MNPLDFVLPIEPNAGCDRDFSFPHNTFSGKEFFQYLSTIYMEGDYLWVCAYRATNSLRLSIAVKKLLINDGVRDSAKEIRKLKNIHTKLYILFNKKGKIVGVFIGSQNLVSPTIIDVMVRVNKTTNNFWKHYFNTLWKQAK